MTQYKPLLRTNKRTVCVQLSTSSAFSDRKGGFVLTKHEGVEHKMKQVSKTAIRKEFLKDLGLALWLERRSRRLSIKKVEKKAGVPSWIIDRIERGLCADIFKLFRLCGYYGRKIRVKLDEWRFFFETAAKNPPFFLPSIPKTTDKKPLQNSF